MTQTLVLALASALFSVVSAASTTQLPPFAWAFLVLLLPVAAAGCLAGRTRTANSARQGAHEPSTATRVESLDGM